MWILVSVQERVLFQQFHMSIPMLKLPVLFYCWSLLKFLPVNTISWKLCATQPIPISNFLSSLSWCWLFYMSMFKFSLPIEARMKYTGRCGVQSVCWTVQGFICNVADSPYPENDLSHEASLLHKPVISPEVVIWPWWLLAYCSIHVTWPCWRPLNHFNLQWMWSFPLIVPW